MSVQHRVPSPFSQLLADESGSPEQYDLADALQWTKEDLEANLTDKNKSLLLDEVLDNLEALESLSDVEIDLEEEAGVDILNQPVWMDSKLYPLESQAQFGQLTTISQLPNGAYEVVSNGAFTPPQTPPYEHQQYQNVAVGYEMPPSAPVASQHQDLSDYSENDLVIPMELPVFSTSQTDVARELAVVDELVRCRANSFASSSPSPSSPSSTSWASSASSSHSSANSSCGESSLEDFEWSPANPQVKKTAQRGRKRSKPYAPADQIDKRSRKKEQNKNAATRYRMKKKAEVAEIQSEENELEQVKIAHEAKIVDLQREIKLMKGLMLEFFKKQGLVQ